MDNSVNILELTDANYTAFMESTDAVVFIDFYSEICPPC
jgi:thiol-disulfide isomerase/thioredoxin